MSQCEYNKLVEKFDSIRHMYGIETVEQLKSLYKTNLMSYLNSNTKVLSVNEQDNLLTVDFNDYIFNDINTKEVLEEVIYTINLSIKDNYNVKEVIFTVNNQEIYKN